MATPHPVAVRQRGEFARAQVGSTTAPMTTPPTPLIAGMRRVRRAARALALSLVAPVIVAACAGTPSASTTTVNALPATTTTPVALPTVVVTYSVLASVVGELVDGVADVRTLVPDGQDPHDYEPSAKDIELLNQAAFVVANGLHFEAGLDAALERRNSTGQPIFYVIDHVTARVMDDADDDHDHDHSDTAGDDGHDHGSVDVHVWTSPATLVDMIRPLAADIGAVLGVDLTSAADDLVASLNALDSEIIDVIATIPRCELVTGHNELGYFADRYGCEVIGTVIPSATTTAEASAGQLATLKKTISAHRASVIFTSLGTPQAVAEQIARESGVRVVVLSTHAMGDADSYATFMRRLAGDIAEALA